MRALTSWIIRLCVVGFIQGLATSKGLPCRLVWVPSSTGARLPADLLPVQEDEQYVARGLSGGQYYIGTYSSTEDLALFPFPNENTTASSLSTYELLTNPHGCTTAWPQKSNGDLDQFPVPTNETGYTTFVGRAIDGISWVSGQIEPEAGGIRVPIGWETQVLSTYQVLISYSKGLRLDVTEFELVNEPFANQMDFLGIDELHNGGNTEIIQKVEHSQTVRETLTVSTTKETTSGSTESSGWNILIAGKETKIEHEYRETVEETITTTRETEIRMERFISVPPFTSITACSTMTFKANLTLDFVAKGVYSAPGLTPQEVLIVLKEEGITGPTIVGTEVVVPIKGTFLGGLAMNTQFIAVPSDDPLGCQVRHEELFEDKSRKWEQFFKSLK